MGAPDGFLNLMTLPRTLSLDRIAVAAQGASVRGDGSVLIADLAYDSRHVAPGTLFFCRPGQKQDGHDFATQAVDAGAVGLVCERPLELPVPQVIVPSAHRAMGPMAARAFGDPSAAMRVVGITGTNGKTTTAFLSEQCFAALGMATGLIGTIETHINGVAEPAGRTTPEAVDIQRLLARMRDAGAAAVAMEVSSHGLALHRVDGMRFACAVFTNLSQDHLDFHGTMEEYRRAKALLFDGSFSDRAAINVDDETGRWMVEHAVAAGLAVTTYSMSGPADVVAERVVMDAAGSSFDCVVAGRRFAVSVRLAGPFNVANALAALAAAAAMELDPEAAAEGIARLPGVPGRFERIDAGQDFTVLVDYAHTPDSVERVLRAARRVCPGALTIVVGCGGDRDRAKRPLMGRAAALLADRAILTSDNPRSEDPRAILLQMEQGAKESGRAYEIEPDRRSAIRAAVAAARAGDVVVIAGKGHESGQEIAGTTIPFDDRVVARQELQAL